MSIADESGVTFKQELRDGKVKFGLFVNSHSTTVAEQLSHLSYDWLLIVSFLLLSSRMNDG